MIYGFFFSRANKLQINWYIGSIVFFFQHSFDCTTQFLVLIDVASKHDVAKYDHSLPIVELQKKESP